MEDPMAILPGQNMIIQFAPRRVEVARRSVLWGENARGKDFFRLLLAKVGQLQHHIVIVWKKPQYLEEDAPAYTLCMDEGESAYRNAVKKTVERLLTDHNLESKYSFSANLGFVPECPTISATEQQFDAEPAIIILRSIWVDFQSEVTSTHPTVHMGIYVERFGDKASLSSFCPMLDQWIDYRRCTLSIGTVVRMEPEETLHSVFCTKRALDALRRGQGTFSKYVVAGHPHLTNITWKKRYPDERLVYEREEWHDTNQAPTLEKLVIYSESSHMAWGLRKRRNPFHRHRMISALVLPAFMAQDMMHKCGRTTLHLLHNMSELRQHLALQYGHLERGRCGMRLEGTYTMYEGYPNFTAAADQIAEVQKEVWNKLVSSHGVISYESAAIWSRYRIGWRFWNIWLSAGSWSILLDFQWIKL
jgi:hypothetical protein